MLNRYPVKKYPMVGVCGLDCGLCSRFHTDGKSKCPGCCGQDFFDLHPSCGFVTCAVKQRGLENCAQCTDWDECEKIFQLFAAARLRDSFISYEPVQGNMNVIKKNGIEEFVRQETAKQEVLLKLLNNFDDGRAKSYYCTACQLIPLDDLKKTIASAQQKIKSNLDIKDKAKLMRGILGELADSMDINLRLRNK